MPETTTQSTPVPFSKLVLLLNYEEADFIRAICESITSPEECEAHGQEAKSLLEKLKTLAAVETTGSSKRHSAFHVSEQRLQQVVSEEGWEAFGDYFNHLRESDRQLSELQDGSALVLPKSKDHAEKMILLGTAYINGGWR